MASTNKLALSNEASCGNMYFVSTGREKEIAEDPNTIKPIYVHDILIPYYFIDRADDLDWVIRPPKLVKYVPVLTNNKIG